MPWNSKIGARGRSFTVLNVRFTASSIEAALRRVSSLLQCLPDSTNSLTLLGNLYCTTTTRRPLSLRTTSCGWRFGAKNSAEARTMSTLHRRCAQALLLGCPQVLRREPRRALHGGRLVRSEKRGLSSSRRQRLATLQAPRLSAAREILLDQAER